MDVSELIQQRLTELQLGQRDLADAVEVTESYISQLLGRKKLPPAPERTDLYEKLARTLDLPQGQLTELADAQRNEVLRKKILDARPLYGEMRALLLERCSRRRRSQMRTIFEREPFGMLERVITGRILDAVKDLARDEPEREAWVRALARASGRSYSQTRVAVLDLLGMSVLNISPDNCVALLDPLIIAWDMDLSSFSFELELNRELAGRFRRKFEFIETTAAVSGDPPGLEEFLKDPVLGSDIVPAEVAFLRRLCFEDGRSPTALYYYRELQNLRDPLHFAVPGSK